MSYTRVIPRDLFNEAKLLKCLGQLALKIHEGHANRWCLSVRHAAPERGFLIDQDGHADALYCVNLIFKAGPRELRLATTINARGTYPLHFVRADSSEDDVFDDNGEFTAEFTGWLDGLTRM